MQQNISTMMPSGVVGDIYDNSPKIVDPYVVNSGAVEGVKATGSLTATANPDNGDTVTVAGVTYTFKTTVSAENDIKIEEDVNATMSSLANTINAGVLVDAVASSATVNLTAKTAGVAGNAYSLASSDSNISVVSFTGGVDTVEAIAKVGNYFSIDPANPHKAQAGNSNGGKLGGILINAKQYANYNNMEATLAVKDNSVAEIMSYGRCYVCPINAVEPGDVVCFRNSDGAIAGASDASSVPSGFTAINGRFILMSANANGLAIVQLGD